MKNILFNPKFDVIINIMISKVAPDRSGSRRVNGR